MPIGHRGCSGAIGTMALQMGCHQRQRKSAHDFHNGLSRPANPVSRTGQQVSAAVGIGPDRMIVAKAMAMSNGGASAHRRSRHRPRSVCFKGTAAYCVTQRTQTHPGRKQQTQSSSSSTYICSLLSGTRRTREDHCLERRSIGTTVGDEPAWTRPRMLNPCRSYSGTLRGFDDSR